MRIVKYFTIFSAATIFSLIAPPVAAADSRSLASIFDLIQTGIAALKLLIPRSSAMRIVRCFMIFSAATIFGLVSLIAEAQHSCLPRARGVPR
jgi:hypothetical protein